MNDRQNNQLNMISGVDSFLGHHMDIISAYPNILHSKEELSARLAQVMEDLGAHLDRTSGVTVDKAKRRAALVETAVMVAAATCGYAALSGDRLLYARTSYAASDWQRFSDATLVHTCQLLVLDATPVVTALAPAVTPVVLDQLRDQISVFQSSVRAPKEARVLRAQATASFRMRLPLIIREVLKARLDHDVLVLQASHPDFVSNYFGMRKIIDR